MKWMMTRSFIRLLLELRGAFHPRRLSANVWTTLETALGNRFLMKMLKCCLQTISSLVHFLGNEKRYRGYIKDKDNKNQWIIDEKAAEVIRRIFHLTMDGKGPYAIARILEADKIDIPAYHQQKLGYGLHQSKVFEYPYRWCSSTIASILKKQEYLGHTVNFKTRKHFKDKKSKYVSEDNEAFFRSIQNEMEESEKTEMEKKRNRQSQKAYPVD